MLCITHGLLQADGQVHHGHIWGGDTEGHAGQLAGTQTSDRPDQTCDLFTSVLIRHVIYSLLS